MASDTKSHLKAARDAISKKDYVAAQNEATIILDRDPENYNAHVFLALSLLELGQFEKSEQLYLSAIQRAPAQLLAWQGISILYERTEQWDKQANALNQLVHLSQDPQKCAESLVKLVSLHRNHGSQLQLISALSSFLPTSPLFPLLATLPPNPALPALHGSGNLDLLLELATLTESLEDLTAKKELEKSRTRLGAATRNPEDLRNQVFLAGARLSKLPILYDAILNHPSTDDEHRRDVEAKQFRYKLRYLQALPPIEKQHAFEQLNDLIHGIVLLRKPDELAWKLFFDGSDFEHPIDAYDEEHVAAFINLFPDSPVSALFNAYYTYIARPLSVPQIEQDPLDAILIPSPDLADTILSHRLMAHVYLNEADYQNAINASKIALTNLANAENNTGNVLSKTRTGIQVILATSLVHFFPPKHHPEASDLLDAVLSTSPNNTQALMARAFILQAAQNWEEALHLFNNVSSLEDDRALRAKEESAWCQCQLGQLEEGLNHLGVVLDELDNDNPTVKLDKARCLWRIGKCHMEIGDSTSAFKSFIDALKQHSEFAPAFTSLGLYYLSRASPPDPLRASKCFQKAFELDPRESVAARKLVEGFANEREWELVEVVAQRTIDGEGGLSAGMGDKDKNRYLPTNAWAWKALGIVKLHNKDYPEAIQALQVALRVDPDDQPLWVRLGEAYSLAGRHVAALKALAHALDLNPADWLCSYFIADVKHAVGQFEEAIQLLRSILDQHSQEIGPRPSVLALLGRTYLDQGCSELESGFLMRAERSFLQAIEVSLQMMERASGFRTIAWKVISDAAFRLAGFNKFEDGESMSKLLKRIPFLKSYTEELDEVVKFVPLPDFGEDVSPIQVVAVAIHACLCRISLYLLSQESNSGVWYDLGVSLKIWSSMSMVASISQKIIEYLRKALQLDPYNQVYWVALGDAYFVEHAKTAQHAYIKALDLDAKNSGTWVRLGLLYAHHGDLELANEALYRAQVLDPDNSLAWVGQFVVASLNEDGQDAGLLLEHAVGLSMHVLEADYEFASRVFQTTKTIQRKEESLLPAFFLLNQYCQRRPQDASGLHLLALVCETLGHFSLSEELVMRAIAILEASYEETEDPEVERRYTIANATLGRARLAQGLYADSLSSFATVSGLLAEKDHLEDGQTRALKVQAYLGTGMAQFFVGDLAEALGALEAGLECAGDDLALRGQVTILLAQTLWAIGSDEAKETAKSRLLESIASDPDNLMAITALAGMGILTNDDTLVDAALTEILALPIDEKKKKDPQRHVDYLLIQHHLSQENTKQALSVAEHAVNAEPSRLEQRNKLASLMMQTGRSKDALAILGGAANSQINTSEIDAATNALRIQATAEARKNQALHKAQQAIIMRPSELKGWQTLAYVRARDTS